MPVWTWLIADVRLEQRIWMGHGQNTTYVQLLRIGGARDLQVRVDPLCTYRDYHWLTRGERGFAAEGVPVG